MTAPLTLEQLRLQAGLSRPKVAQALGLSERHVYRLERGITPLRRTYATKLAALYEVSRDEVEASAPRLVLEVTRGEVAA